MAGESGACLRGRDVRMCAKDVGARMASRLEFFTHNLVRGGIHGDCVCDLPGLLIVKSYFELEDGRLGGVSREVLGASSDPRHNGGGRAPLRQKRDLRWRPARIAPPGR